MSSKATRPDGRDQGNPVLKSPEDALAVEVEGLRYELDRPATRNGRKVVVSVRLAAGGDSAPLVDRADLYSFRQRHGLSVLVSEAFARKPDEVMGALALLLDQVERLAATAKKAEPVVLTQARRTAGEKLLRSGDLLERASRAVEGLGFVGEQRNRKLAYLVATSRLLARPLSAILRAPSGSGKSELLEKTALLVPEESVEYLSRLTPGALYYLGPDHLRHKLVLVDEQSGASEADYPIRTLQSKGMLRTAAVVRGKTEPFVVHGPIALMSGTTDATINAENLSRCLELWLDDSPEQTRRIQEAQRKALSGEAGAKLDVQAFQDAQRLLEPFEVVIPFAARLEFPSRTTRDRRENMKLLTLVQSHALLHQLQRERDGKGRVLATLDDYRAVFELFWPLVEAEVEDLSPRAANLYRALVRRESAEPISRRDASVLMGWTYTTTRRALDELLGQELLRVASHETPRTYVLVDGIALEKTATLKHPDVLAREL